MKTNWEFYKEESEEIEMQEEKIANLRKNIINWYPLKENSSILEINANFGEITEELCKKANYVTAIEGSKKKVEVIGEKLEQIENLEVIVGKLKNIEINKQFDYIFINGIEEQEEKLEDYIKFAKKQLHPEGTILFTCDNKFGLDICNINCQKTETKRYISKKEIEETLNTLGFTNYKFYYPLPNYKMPNVIFTDKHMPSSESILRDLTLYDENDVLIWDEREKYKEILKENKELFKFFANSYLVEISKEDNKIEFVSFGNSRKEKYRMKTVMLEDVVCKQNVSEIEKEHLERIKENIKILKELNINLLDRYEEDKIYSKLVRKEKTLDKILIHQFEEGKGEEGIQLIEKFVIEIKEKLSKAEKHEGQTVFEKYNIKIEDEINHKLHYTAFGIYDLIFQNCFYIDNQFYFYDQEWREENIPIEFIIYRSIYYLANSKAEIERQKLYEKFELLEYIEVFEKLEAVLQEEIKDKWIWEIHAKNHTTVKNLYDTQIHYKNLKALAEQKLLQEQEINKQKEQKIKELTNEINCIKNSKSWKMTKIFRDIKRGMNNERKE